MYAKSGLSLIAAAGVAVGVIGMTMGGASGAPAPTCEPSSTSAEPSSTSAMSGSGNGDTSNANASTSSNGAGTNGANAAGTGAAGPVGPAGDGSTTPTGTGPSGPAGTDPTPGDANNGSNGHDGALISIDADTTTGSDAGSVPTPPTTPATHNGSDHFLNLHGNTDRVNAADTATVPPSATHVIGRSQRIGRLLHVDGVANLGR